MATFSGQQGQPEELPEYLVPPQYKEWEVKVRPA